MPPDMPVAGHGSGVRCWGLCRWVLTQPGPGVGPQPPGEGAACSTMQRAGGFLETTSAADLQRSWQKYVSKLLPALSPGSR